MSAMMGPIVENQPDPGWWKDQLNARAAELGLEKNVNFVTPKHGEVGVISWVYEKDGVLVDLGWSVEIAEASLRDLAGAGG